MSKVYRCYTEKGEGFDVEAQGVLKEARDSLGIEGLTALRLFNRYDVEGIDAETYAQARGSVFSEPQVDDCYDETMPEMQGEHWILAVEALPGQYDQRADSCAQCIQILTCLERPVVRAAKLYVFFGALTDADRDRLRNYLINPVESRQAELSKPETLEQQYPQPAPVATLTGFTDAEDAELEEILSKYSLAMDMDDLKFMQGYFKNTER
ncbi:MAG: phosphoribosylformylglycinamidine synthase, partial [Oscillospiraceae bacterium]|nr:phosphoribosylformylglycinamidine synthase [Oscillospiraceae bacterium]